jgi:hypothetical protein
MSMIHTVGWYRRHHLQHPDLELWPAAAALTAGDVLVAGESMTMMARTLGTPCTRVAEAGRGHRERSRDDGPYCAVIVASVEVVVPAADGDGVELWLDAELDGCEPLEESMRLIGRVSKAQGLDYTIRPSRRHGDLRALLPGDLRAGDLVAFVVAQPVALHDIRRRTHHRERLL